MPRIGLNPIINESELLSRLLPMRVPVVYLPKFNIILLVARVALKIYFNPAHLNKIQISEVKRLIVKYE